MQYMKHSDAVEKAPGPKTIKPQTYVFLDSSFVLYPFKVSERSFLENCVYLRALDRPPQLRTRIIEPVYSEIKAHLIKNYFDDVSAIYGLKNLFNLKGTIMALSFKQRTFIEFIAQKAKYISKRLAKNGKPPLSEVDALYCGHCITASLCSKVIAATRDKLIIDSTEHILDILRKHIDERYPEHNSIYFARDRKELDALV